MLSPMKQEENASVTKNSNLSDYSGKDGGQQLQYPPNHYVDANGNIKYFTRQGSYPMPSNQFKQFYPPPQQTLIKQQQLKLQRMQSQQAQMQQNQQPQMQSSQSQPPQMQQPQMQQQQMPLQQQQQQQQQLPLQQQQMPMQQQQQQMPMQQQQMAMQQQQQPKPFQQQMMQPQQLQQMRPQQQPQQQQQQMQQRLSFYDNPPVVPQAMDYYNGSYTQNQQYQQMDNMANGSYAQQMNQPQQDYYQSAAPMNYQLDTNQYHPQSNYYQCNQQQRNVVYDNAGMYQQGFNNQYQTDYYKMYNNNNNNNNMYGFDHHQQQLQQQDFPSETEMSNVEYHQGGASKELVSHNYSSSGGSGYQKELVHPKETFEKLCQNIPLCKTCAEIIRHHFYANGDLDEVKKLAETSRSDRSLGRRDKVEEPPTKEIEELDEMGGVVTESEAASGGESEGNAAAGGDTDSAIYEGHPSKKETPSVHNFVEDKCSRCGGWTLVQKEEDEQ